MHTNLICANEGCSDFLDLYAPSFTQCIVCMNPLKKVTHDEYEILRMKWWRRQTGGVVSQPVQVEQVIHLQREIDWPHFCDGKEDCHDSDFETDKAAEKKL